MSLTLADSLEIVLPHLPPTLASPEVLPRIRNLARILPHITPAGFEFRLRPDDPQVDLLQCIPAREDAPLHLAEHIRTRDLDVEPAWARLRDFCIRWSDASSPLCFAVRDIWLEFDLDDDSTPAAPIPSVFISLNTTFIPANAYAAVEAALPLLWGDDIPPPLKENIARCFSEMPRGGAVSHIGVMLSRTAGVLRVNVQGLGPEQIPPYLAALGWSAPMDAMEPLLAQIFDTVDHATLCLDVGATLYPRIGLECTAKNQADRPAQLARLLDVLLAQNLCARSKRNALLEWTGASSPKTSTVAFPPDVIVRTLIEPPDTFLIMGRRLSHIKLAYVPGRPIEAKAYVGFGYVRSDPGVTRAEPMAVLQSTEGIEGLLRADRVRAFHFPDDHGPHCEYRTEWWYYTGNLATTNGRRFGYQLTFFRQVLTPPSRANRVNEPRPQLYFAHFAITDVEQQQHLKSERYSRAGGGLDAAGASGTPYSVWIDDWRIDSLNADGSEVQLQATHPSRRPGERDATHDATLCLDLTLRSCKPLVLQGNAGLSQKTDAAGNASYYISYTRMQTHGTVRVNGEVFKVEGLSWMDHEWGTTELGARAEGWDWFSIQLDDGRDVMFYHIRNRDGSVELLSLGVVVEADGTVVRLALAQVELTVLETWQSATSGTTYPAHWRLEIPSAHLALVLTPRIAAQEMPSSHTYWEGTVRVQGTSNGANVIGSGYVELTGYGQSKQIPGHPKHPSG